MKYIAKFLNYFNKFIRIGYMKYISIASSLQ